MTWNIFAEKQRTMARIEKKLAATRQSRNILWAELLAGGPKQLNEVGLLHGLDAVNKLDNCARKLERELAQMKRHQVSCVIG